MYFFLHHCAPTIFKQNIILNKQKTLYDMWGMLLLFYTLYHTRDFPKKGVHICSPLFSINYFQTENNFQYAKI
jgi:hypothetical protein